MASKKFSYWWLFRIGGPHPISEARLGEGASRTISVTARNQGAQASSANSFRRIEGATDRTGKRIALNPI